MFLFVGEGHKKEWAIEYARGHSLSNCRFHGYVSREELGRLLSMADLGLVALSEGQEGLSVPSKTFGLMAAGVPVLAVVPAACEIARIAKEENCGLWIKPGDTEELAKGILQLRNDNGMCQMMGANGMKAIERKYSLAHASRQYADLVARVNAETRNGYTAAVPHTQPSEY
jgi:glycosyltransferase involved in cell wall biosynthesis